MFIAIVTQSNIAWATEQKLMVHTRPVNREILHSTSRFMVGLCVPAEIGLTPSRNVLYIIGATTASYNAHERRYNL